MTSVRCSLERRAPVEARGSARERREEVLELCAFDGKQFRLISAEAFAPGQPLTLTAGLPTPVTLELKSLGSRRRPDGHYEVRARAATLSRAARTALLRFFERA